MNYYNNFSPFNMFGFGFLFMFLFWGLVIYGLVVLFRHIGSDSSTKGHGGKVHATDILKERYAKGEINKEQFEEMKKDLQ